MDQEQVRDDRCEGKFRLERLLRGSSGKSRTDSSTKVGIGEDVDKKERSFN